MKRGDKVKVTKLDEDLIINPFDMEPNPPDPEDYIGKIGTITETELGGDEPEHAIKFDDGLVGWFIESEVELA